MIEGGVKEAVCPFTFPPPCPSLSAFTMAAFLVKDIILGLDKGSDAKASNMVLFLFRRIFQARLLEI